MTTAIESAVLSENFPPDVEALKPIPSIPDWLNDYGLTSDEFRVYGYVANKASVNGKCRDSVVVIAHVCRLARNVVLAALQKQAPGLPPASQKQATRTDRRVFHRARADLGRTGSSRGQGFESAQNVRRRNRPIPPRDGL